ncbi:MAG: beta strand repeat-containing protein [Vicinamibacterales bacterium]
MRVLRVAVLCVLASVTSTSVFAQTYNPVGPQTSVAITTVTGGGWTQCFTAAWEDAGTAMSTITASCTGDRLMLACAPNGSGTLTVLAQALRADVLFDTGNNNTTTHAANGSEWYFNGNRSWGFAPSGESVTKSTCDVVSATNRLCFHMSPTPDQTRAGWQCGTTQTNSAGTTKYIYQPGVTTPPTFDKSFAPATIAAGATSTLTFTIDNTASADVATALAFTDTLPAGVTVAGTPNAATTCTSGTVAATAGAGTISLSGGQVAAGASCTVTADVTSTTAGMHTNTSGDLTSSSGNSGTASDTLTVNPPPVPTFSKSFAPDTIASGGTSTLTFTISNTTSLVAATSLAFTDTLPAGVTVANPANASTTCTNGTLTATAGATSISLSGGEVAAGGSCTATADVTSSTAGSHVNTSGALTSSAGTSGTASDTLTVSAAPGFSKSFAPDTIAGGGVSTLTFTIDNSGGSLAATSLAFTDTLPAGVVVANPANGASTCTGGTVTATAGAGTIGYSGGQVGVGASCTVTADVTSSTAGAHANTSGALTSSAGSSGTASDTLTVSPAPTFSKSFAPDPIVGGGVSTLTFTIDNSGGSLAVTGLGFTDTLPAGVVVANPANGASTCTAGTVTATAGAGTISYSGGQVGVGASCTVTADVTSSTPGAHVNTSGALTSSGGDSGTASDTLTVSPPPTFTKSFAPASMVPGGVSTLTFTINNTGSGLAATALAFTDTLPAGVTVATPANGAATCTGGTLTAADGATTITYSGGQVGATSTCTVAVDVTSSTVGSHVNTSSALTSSSGTSGMASATLTVNSPAAPPPPEEEEEEPPSEGTSVEDITSPTGTGSIDVEIGGGSTCRIDRAVTTTAEAEAGGGPEDIMFPHGLLALGFDTCTPGGTVTITVRYPTALPEGTQYWKYGKTPADPTPHWYTVPATVQGNTVTFQLTDGGAGDDDLTANGRISDPGGAGASATAVPAMPVWGLVILSGLLLAATRLAWRLQRA